MIRKYKNLSPQFIFLYPTLNFRNTEIGACIGINQLKTLDKITKKEQLILSFLLVSLMRQNILRIFK